MEFDPAAGVKTWPRAIQLRLSVADIRKVPSMVDATPPEPLTERGASRPRPRPLTRRAALAGAAGALISMSMRGAEAQPQEGLAAIRARHPAPALAAAAQRRAGPLLRYVDGEREIHFGVAVTRDDLWHVGSVTKSMTSCLFARLVEQGALRWDMTVGEILSDVAPNMRAQYRAATFRHLLSHRSGMPSNVSVFDYIRYRKLNPDPREERQDYVRRALAMTPKGPIERTFEYSNNGYIVAGAMMENVLGQSWEDMMRAQVFGPLGMSGAGFGAPGMADQLDEPRGHMADLLGGGAHAVAPGGPDADNPAVMGPCGAVHVSLSDMISYLAAHRDRSAFLSDQSWTTLHTPPFGGDYAMGWFVHADGQLFHGGWNRRWVALVNVDAPREACAFAATNDGRQAISNPAVEEALGFAKAEALKDG